MIEPNPQLLAMSHEDLAILAQSWLRRSVYWRNQAAELNQLLQANWNNQPAREEGRTIVYRDPTGNQATDLADRKAS